MSNVVNARLGYYDDSGDNDFSDLGNEYVIADTMLGESDLEILLTGSPVTIRWVRNSSGSTILPGRAVKEMATSHHVEPADPGDIGDGIADPRASNGVPDGAKFFIVTKGPIEVYLGGTALDGDYAEVGSGGSAISVGATKTSESFGKFLEDSSSVFARADVNFETAGSGSGGGGGANLAYTPTPTDGSVSSDTGTDATIPSVDSTNAGLMLPGDKDKIDLVSITQPVDLDNVENIIGTASATYNTFAGSIISDNSTIKNALEELETAIENSVVEIADGDKGDITVSGGGTNWQIDAGVVGTSELASSAVTTVKIADDAVTAAKLSHTGVTAGSYTNANITVDDQGRITVASNGAGGGGGANLGYTPSTVNGVVTSDSGSNATVPAASPAVAGLMVPADKNKIDFVTITQAVNVDNLESIVGLSTADLQTFSGSIITDNVSIKVALQELELAVEGVAAGGIADGDKGDIVVSGGGTNWQIEANAVTTAEIADNSVINQKIPMNGLEGNRLVNLTVPSEKMSNTGVSAGSYTNANITVDAAGRITVASNGSGGGGATNLAYVTSAINGTVTSDTGTDATLPLADGTSAGLVIPGPIADAGKVLTVAAGGGYELATVAVGGTNLAYSPSPTQGVVTNTGGTDATVTAVTSVNAGLMLPGDKDKVDFITITQSVNVDNLESIVGLTTGDLQTFTGTIISNNTTIKNALQELESAIESTVGLTDGDKGDITVSGGGTNWQIDSSTVGPTELVDTGVSAGSYTSANITVDAQGRITAAASGGGGSANLAYTASASNGIVTSDAGTDATLPLADGSNAGLVIPAPIADAGKVLTVSAGGGFELANVAVGGTNLGYTAAATQGTVTNSGGTNSTLPAVNSTNAGLMLPGDKDKVDFITITQSVNLDSLEADVADLTTLTGVASNSTDLGTFPGGSVVSDNVDIKTAFSELDAAVTGTVGLTDGDKGDITVSGGGTVWNIDPGVVGPTELASGAVTTVKIADDAVTAAKLDNTGVSAGSYTSANITVDAQGRITSASSTSTIGLTDGDKGDITVSGLGTVWNIDADTVGSIELDNTGVSAGSYTNANITVDANGRITLASNGSVASTNLGYTASPTQGIVTNDAGTNATIPAATGVNAGLLLPADFTKLGHISVTQAVDLDNLEAVVGTTAATTGLGTGSTLSDSTIVTNLQELETAVETKLDETLSSTQVFVGSAGNVATGVALSGDVGSLTNAGVLTIANLAITTPKIANDAVTADKLDDTGVIAGSYTSASITVDAQGRLTAASNGAISDTTFASTDLTSGSPRTHTINSIMTMTGAGSKIYEYDDGANSSRVSVGGAQLRNRVIQGGVTSEMLFTSNDIQFTLTSGDVRFTQLQGGAKDDSSPSKIIGMDANGNVKTVTPQSLRTYARGILLPIGSGGAAAWSLVDGNYRSITTTSSFTLAFPSGVVAGETAIIYVNSGGAGHNITLGTGFETVGGAGVALSGTSGAKDRLEIFFDTATTGTVTVSQDIQ